MRCAVPADWEHVGKFWGYIRRENLPLSDCKTLVLPKAAMIKIRRTLRRFLRSKRIRRGARTPVRLCTEERAQWLRVMLYRIFTTHSVTTWRLPGTIFA